LTRNGVGLAALMLLMTSGCGGSANGVVVGKVTYQGEAVGAGTVAFYGPSNEVTSAPLRGDGSYEAYGVAVGRVKVTVTTPPPPPSPEQLADNPMIRRKGVRLAEAKKTIELPAKYANTDSSDLNLTVTPGTQTYNITLP
jgi:hypothetical protein